jgi:hypothetical protein
MVRMQAALGAMALGAALQCGDDVISAVAEFKDGWSMLKKKKKKKKKMFI